MLSQKTSTHDDVLTIIGSHASQGTSLRLTKSFQGMMLSQDVKVLAVDRYRAVFQIFDSKTCAALDGRVHLHSREFSRPVSARLIDLCVSEGKFALTDFAYTNSDWKERQHERVRPKDPTYVSLHCRRESMRASLQTISIGGIGVLACKNIQPDTMIKPNSIVKLDFQITPNYGWESLKGVVVYMFKVKNSFTRCGIRILPNTKQARLLERYIYLRKREIMEELDQAFITASSPMGAECQYF